jgi:two-component system, OmpR family, phosphate regulon response regulator PhoB
MPPHILVVEDEEPLLELLRYNLEKAGYVVETIANGDCAEARLKETVADLLVLDWMLPGLSGIELCRRLRQAVATKNLPIIILTGAARNQIACAASKPVPTTTSPSRSR